MSRTRREIDARLELRDETGELSAPQLDVLAQEVDRRMAAEVRDGVDPGLVRDRAVLVAPAVEHDGTQCMDLARVGAGEARLADSRFTREDGDAAEPVRARFLERAVEHRALRFARDEHRRRVESGRQRHLQRQGRHRRGVLLVRVLVERIPLGAEHLDRIGEALQVEASHRGEAVCPSAAGECAASPLT